MATWREKLAIVQAEIDALKQRADKLVGTKDLARIEANANQQTIEAALHHARTKNLLVYPVFTAGARCLIMSSRLFPEFGILLFDGQYGEGAQVTIVGTEEWQNSPKFRMVCGCCNPHLEGMAAAEREEQIRYDSFARQSFALAIKGACGMHRVTQLFFQCYGYYLEQEEDGFLAFGWDNMDCWSRVDRWRFAAAFRELAFGQGYTFPFEMIFDRKSG